MDTTFITRIGITGKFASLIERLHAPDKTPPNLIRDGLINALCELDSNMRMAEPKKKNLWVSKYIPETLEMRHDFKEGSPVHNHIVGFMDCLSRKDALSASPIASIEIFKVSPGAANCIPVDAEAIFCVSRDDPQSLRGSITGPAHTSPPSRAHDAIPSTPSMDAHSSLPAIPRPHGLPPKPATTYSPASATSKISVISGGVPISTVRTGASTTSAGASTLPTKPISRGIGSHKQSEASSSSPAPAMRRRSSSSMSISTSGSATPYLASAQLPVSHPQLKKSAREPSAVGKLPKTDISGMAGMTATHGKQMLDPFAFPAIGSSAAAPSITPHRPAIAKAPSQSSGQSAFGPPPTAVSAFPQSASGQSRQKLKLLGGTPGQGSRGPGPSNQSKRQAAKNASKATDAEELAQTKQLLFDLLKTLDLERTEHAEELEAAKKRHADELQAEWTKYGRDLTAAKAEYAQEVAEVRAQWAEDVRTIASQQLKVDDEARKAAEGVKEAHEQEMAGLRAKWAEDVRANVDRRLEVEKVANEIEGELKRAKDAHAREVVEVKAQWEEDVRAYEARQLEVRDSLKEVKKDIKQQVANASKEAEMKATKLLEMQKRQSVEEIQKMGLELEIARRDAEIRKQEMVGMKRKRVEMVGRLVRMRGEDATSPRTGREDDEADIIGTIASLESYIQGMRMTLQSEISSRQAAEHELRVLRDVDRECKEPFVIPALLEAFVKLARLGDGLAEDSR